jgi:hypothetical protein
MLYLLYALTAFLICWFFRLLVRGRLINFFYSFALLIDALKDCFCQLIIDTERLWKWARRKKKIHDLDVTDDYYHRD